MSIENLGLSAADLVRHTVDNADCLTEDSLEQSVFLLERLTLTIAELQAVVGQATKGDLVEAREYLDSF